MSPENVNCLCPLLSVHLRQQRHLLAARSIVLGSAEDSATPGSPQSNCPPQNDSGPVGEDSPEEKGRQQEPEQEPESE